MSVPRVLVWLLVLVVLIVALIPWRGCSPLPDQLSQGADALRDGRRDQAVALFNSAIKNGGNAPEVFRAVAMTCIARAAYDLGEQYAQRGLAANPHASKADRANLEMVAGEAALQEGAPERAIGYYRAALALVPYDPTVKNDLGFALAEANASPADLQEALQLTLEAVTAAAQDPDHYDEHTLGTFVDSLGWVYYRLGRYDEALDTLRQAADLDPGESAIEYHAALACVAKGKLQEAYVYLQRAVNANPADAAMQKRLAAMKAELAAHPPAASSGKPAPTPAPSGTSAPPAPTPAPTGKPAPSPTPATPGKAAVPGASPAPPAPEMRAAPPAPAQQRPL